MKVNDIVRGQIMTRAWTRFRAGAYLKFADALKAAWAHERKAQAFAKKFMAKARANGGVVAFNDVTRSLTRRALQGQAYASDKIYRGAYVTAVFGR